MLCFLLIFFTNISIMQLYIVINDAIHLKHSLKILVFHFAVPLSSPPQYTFRVMCKSFLSGNVNNIS